MSRKTSNIIIIINNNYNKYNICTIILTEFCFAGYVGYVALESVIHPNSYLSQSDRYTYKIEYTSHYYLNLLSEAIFY